MQQEQLQRPWSPVQDDSPQEPYEYPVKFLQSMRQRGLPTTVISASSVNNFKNRLDDSAEWGT